MEPILGMVYLFAGNFAPCGIPGTTYGGDGVNNFGLPKLSAPIPGARYAIAVTGTFPNR
jgi:microcystin-dependent protein